MLRKLVIAFALASVPLAGCSSVGEGADIGIYTLVRAKPTKVISKATTNRKPRATRRPRASGFQASKA